MKLKNILLYLSSLMLFAIIGCEDSDDSVVAPTTGGTTIETPTEYDFTSRFDENSSVSYTGQVVRNLLIGDIKGQMGTDAGSGNPATLLAMMANSNADQDILAAANLDLPTVQTKYHDVSSSADLNSRLTAVADIILPGYNANAGDCITGWVNEAAVAGITRANGVHLGQITQKTLWGAVSYWQATSKYFNYLEGDVETNGEAVEGKNYSSMEHHWDESFGYFGAAVDYHTASSYADDNARKTQMYFDTNSDSEVDFLTEFTTGWAVTAAKRDLCTGCTTGDFTETIFNAYLEGRTLITNQASIADILVQRDIVNTTWEQVVAAVTMHYINDTWQEIYNQVTATDFDAAAFTPGSAAAANYEVYWAEMRGYAHGLLYNKYSDHVSDTYEPSATLASVFEVMGTAPVYPDADGSTTAMVAYHEALKGLKSTFMDLYNFSQADVDNF